MKVKLLPLLNTAPSLPGKQQGITGREAHY